MLYGRATDDEIVRGVAPDFLEPLEIRFESARRQDDGVGADDGLAAIRHNRCAAKTAIDNVEREDLGVVDDRDAQPLGGRVIAVHQRLAATQKECVRAIQLKRAAERRLEPSAELSDPRRTRRRVAHDKARQQLVGLAAGHSNQIREVLLF